MPHDGWEGVTSPKNLPLPPGRPKLLGGPVVLWSDESPEARHLADEAQFFERVEGVPGGVHADIKLLRQ